MEERTSEAHEKGVALQELVKQFVSVSLSPQLRTDNTADLVTLTKTEFRTLEMRTRHFDLRAAWAPDVMMTHGIPACRVPGESLVADALTETLAKEKLKIARERLSLQAGVDAS